MVVNSRTLEHAWRLLWSQTAYQIITAIPSLAAYEIVSAGYGWGLRDRFDPRKALLLHPCAYDRCVGDLTLMVLDVGRHVIPRRQIGYIAYITTVAAAVENTAHVLFEHG